MSVCKWNINHMTVSNGFKFDWNSFETKVPVVITYSISFHEFFTFEDLSIWLCVEINKGIVFKGEMKQHVDSSIEYH